eukprot:13714023-Alexandrium_andersonii.AAC.1
MALGCSHCRRTFRSQENKIARGARSPNCAAPKAASRLLSIGLEKCVQRRSFRADAESANKVG